MNENTERGIMFKLIIIAVVVVAGLTYFGVMSDVGEFVTEMLPEAAQQYSPFDAEQDTEQEATPSTPTSRLVELSGLPTATPAPAQESQTAPDLSESEEEILEWTVVSVQDGDTLTIEAEGGLHVRLRLAGIDTPELAQAGGEAAKNYLKSCAGDDVAILVVDQDQYGRLVSVVYSRSDSAQSCNLQLVREGLAYTYMTQDPALLEAEATAQQGGYGVWRDDTALKPWDWRKANPRE